MCLSWGEQFIRFIKSVVSEPTEHSAEGRDKDAENRALNVWRVKFAPGAGVSVALLDAEGVQEVEDGDDRIGFLPRWYLKDLGVLSEVDHKAEESAAGPASLQSPSPDDKPPEKVTSVP